MLVIIFTILLALNFTWAAYWFWARNEDWYGHFRRVEEEKAEIALSFEREQAESKWRARIGERRGKAKTWNDADILAEEVFEHGDKPRHYNCARCGEELGLPAGLYS